MKKRILAAMLLMLMLLSACGEDTPVDTPEPTGTILAQDDNFVVTEDHSSGVTKYSYTIRPETSLRAPSAQRSRSSQR